jgi:hypothetical protein
LFSTVTPHFPYPRHIWIMRIPYTLASSILSSPYIFPDIILPIPLTSLRALTTINGDETKSEWDNQSQERADALESLLELCALLLKQDKLEELSGVPRPFGEDAVSSRETAIWLTKSLSCLPRNLMEEPNF